MSVITDMAGFDACSEWLAWAKKAKVREFMEYSRKRGALMPNVKGEAQT